MMKHLRTRTKAIKIIEAHGLRARPCQLYVLAYGVGVDPKTIQARRGRILAAMAREKVSAFIVFRTLAHKPTNDIAYYAEELTSNSKSNPSSA